MKGGVGAKYVNGCDTNLESMKTLDKIEIQTYDKTTKNFDYIKFENYDVFCKFIEKNDYGIKLFNTVKEANSETNQMLYFLKTMKKTFIEKYTCIATYNSNSFIIKIINFKGNIFKNAKGDLKEALVLRELKLNPHENFKKIYTETLYFLQAIHHAKLYYGDLKCNNIFIGKKNNIIIGDYGSIRTYNKLDSELNEYSYTFRTPIHEEFVNYWINGKGSKFTFIKKVNDYDSTIFSEKNLKLVSDNWLELDILEEPDLDDYNSEHEYDEKYDIYDYKYYKFYANAADWFHFGIAMIELIIHLKDEDLFDYINIIFDYFCRIPMMNDIDYPFKLLEFISNIDNKVEKSKLLRTV